MARSENTQPIPLVPMDPPMSRDQRTLLLAILVAGCIAAKEYKPIAFAFDALELIEKEYERRFTHGPK